MSFSNIQVTRRGLFSTAVSGIVFGAVLIGGVTSASPTARLTVTTDFGETSGSNPVGPAVVWFDVTGYTGWDTPAPTGGTTYDARLHKIHIFWDFGDSGATPHSNINIPTIWRDTNKGMGHSVCHHYAPGTYNWSYLAYEESSGKWASGGGTITVVDDDTVYTTTRTACFSPDNDFTGAPSGASTHTTLSSLNSWIAARISASETWRVLLRRGEEYEYFVPTVGAGSMNARFDAYGTGNNPKLIWGEDCRASPDWNFGDCAHQYIGNIDVDIGYDATTDTGRVGDSQIFAGQAEHCDWYNVRCSGVQNAAGGQTSTIQKLAFVNCEAVDWISRGAFFGDALGILQKIAFVGTSFANPRDSVTGFMERVGYVGAATNYDGFVCGAGAYPIRIENADTVIIQQSYTNVLTTSLSLPITRDTSWGQQKNLRLNTKGNQGAYYNIYQHAMEGGQYCAVTSPESDGSLTNSRTGMNLVMDSCLFIPTCGTQTGVFGTQRGTTVRNSIFYRGDLQGRSGSSIARLIDMSESGTLDALNLAAEVRCYNNTVIGRGTYVSVQTKRSSSTNITEENNILDTAGSVSGLADDVSILLGFVPRLGGVRVGPKLTETTLGVAVINGNTMTFSYPSGTNQAYWLGLTDNDHAIAIGKAGTVGVFYSKAVTNGTSEFSVSFDASVITVTNNSGVTWRNGDTCTLKLDESSQLTTDIAPDYGLAESKLTAVRPTAGNFEIASGLESFRDLEDMERGATKNQGALESM